MYHLSKLTLRKFSVYGTLFLLLSCFCFSVFQSGYYYAKATDISGLTLSRTGVTAQRVNTTTLYAYVIDGLNSSGVNLYKAVIESGSSFPSGIAGRMYYRSDLATLYYYNGSWVACSSYSSDLSVYLTLDGSRALTGDWAAGNGTLGITSLLWLNSTSVSATNYYVNGQQISFASGNSFIINAIGSTYQMISGSNNTICWASTNSSAVFKNVIDNVSSGGHISIKAGTYNLNGSIIATSKNGITLSFENGAALYVANGMNKQAVILTSCANWIIEGITINGNSANQAEDTVVGVEFVNCTNCAVKDAIIDDCNVYGFNTYGGNGNGIQDSKVTRCDWNCIQLGYYGNEEGLYAIHNEAAYCSDVGITTYGIGSLIEGNYVHDTNGTDGFSMARWGIGVEGGGQNIIAHNTIERVNYGIYINVGDSNVVSENQLINWSTVETWKNAIRIQTNNNLISKNTLNSTDATAMGIYIAAGDNNQIKDNNIVQCANYVISDSGTNTRISGNDGYNPVGAIALPLGGTSNTTIVDSGVTATWVNGTTYTCSQSPKNIYISGGTIISVAVEGETVYTATSCMVHLEATDTIAITWSDAPTIKVIGE